MATNSLLDTDMATVASWFRSGFAWWMDELRAMLPAALRRRDHELHAYVLYRGTDDWDKVGRGDTLPLLIDPALCLLRQMTLPPMGEVDLRCLVQLDADRILPMPASQLVIAAKAGPEDRTVVTVAGFPRERAREMLAEMRAKGIAPARIGVADARASGRMALDLTPGLAEAGLIEPVGKTAVGWWAIVAFLFALNIGLLVWRDVQEVARLEALVAEQAPAVNAARAIASRIANTQRQAQQLASRRSRQDAVAILAAVTEALPERAWVQRYAWDGSAIRLSGYKREGVDIIGALRKSPHFAEIRAGNAEAIAEVPTGQPFDLTATVKGGAR